MTSMKSTDSTPRFVVRGVQSEGELRAANDLMAKTQLPNYWDSMGWLESAGPAWAGVRREHTRIAVEDGELVGALRLLPLTLRIGRARLGAVGVGWVSTPPQHRGRGVCRALMGDALEHTRQSGAAFSLLYGVPDLYHRFGHTAMLPEHSVVVDTATVDRSCAPRATVRQVTREDIPALMRMHDAHEADASCSIVRTAAHYRSQFISAAPKTPYWCDWPSARVLLDGRGGIVAYFMPQRAPGELHIKELGVTDRSSCRQLLGVTAAMARELHLDRLRFHAPPYHPMARYLENLDSVHQARYFANREGMMALTHLEGCLTAMIPEWSECLRRVGLNQTPCECTLCVQGTAFRVVSEASGLRIEKGFGKNRVPLDETEFVRLVSGYAYAQDMVAEKAPRLKGDALRFVLSLFPKRAPFIWPIDHF